MIIILIIVIVVCKKKISKYKALENRLLIEDDRPTIGNEPITVGANSEIGELDEKLSTNQIEVQNLKISDDDSIIDD